MDFPTLWDDKREIVAMSSMYLREEKRRCLWLLSAKGGLPKERKDHEP